MTASVNRKCARANDSCRNSNGREKCEDGGVKGGGDGAGYCAWDCVEGYSRT